MRTKEQIGQLIRNHLPMVFGDQDSVNRDKFREKYDALVDYAASVSAPFLGAETVRYQSMLLYVSLLFLSISLFRIGKVKIGEALISVDRKLLVIYVVFIAAIALIFLVKAYVDYQRARFVRERNDDASSELRNLITVGLARKHIQEYFWLEIYDAIGRCYGLYDDAARAALNQPPEFKHISMQAFNVDRAALGKNPETKAELDRQDAHLAALIQELGEDENRFREQAETILAAARAQPEDPLRIRTHRPVEELRAAYNQTLGKWIDARNRLNDQHLDFALERMGRAPEVVRLEAMVGVLKRIRTIRQIYAVLEIGAPVAFAIFAIAYVRFG
jgi:hypothetical protein